KDETRIQLSSKPGGSALVYELLKAMITPDLTRVEGTDLDEELLNRPKDKRITTSWTLWREFSNPGLTQTSYRLWKWHEFETANWDYSLNRLSGYPNLLVIQDSGLGFRNCSAGWPEALSLENGDKRPAHIIVKLGQYNDGKENPLLKRIMDLGLADRTTIVSSLSDLRACTVKVGISLSWERMLEEVVSAVLSPNCPFVNKNGNNIKYKQVIVPIGLSGAIIVGREVNTLIFDRQGQEGDFASQYPGQIIGDNTCIIGALAACYAENPEAMDWQNATRIGIELARLLHIKGYDVVEHDNYRHLQFPYQTIGEVFRDLKSGRKATTSRPFLERIGELGIYTDHKNMALSNTGQWTILEDTLGRNQEDYCSLEDLQSIRAVNELARNIVVHGPQKTLPDVPVETVGVWSSADRQEIEGVRSVNNAMRDYLQLKNPEKPLCVAVFGPPGVGKSFVIKEIAKGLGISEKAQLTFNLSQFETADELQTAFNQVRDLNLKGTMPLVFWDEFDTPCQGQPLGWLRFFLAPMQDGEFTHQGMAHPLGGGIYVFAGATRHSFEEFRYGDNAEDRAAKKPDFISRLRAFINIRGINGNPNTVEDRLFMIRRAFILRQYLETNAPQIKHD
ncbi:MAG: AAA family ATPase, partial [Syntrophomonas sp.]